MKPDEPPKAGHREWIALAVIALPCRFATLTPTVTTLRCGLRRAATDTLHA